VRPWQDKRTVQAQIFSGKGRTGGVLEALFSPGCKVQNRKAFSLQSERRGTVI
jgi:hypothetical protein